MAALGAKGGLLRMLSARSLSRAVAEIRATDGVTLTVRAVEAVKM
jgi:hypothetical protein